MGPGERHGPERRAVQRSARKFSTVFLWRKRPGIEGRTVSSACFHWGLFWVQSALLGAYVARFRQEIRRDRKSAPRRTALLRTEKDRPLRTASLRTDPCGPPPCGPPPPDRLPADRPLRTASLRTAPLGLAQRAAPEGQLAPSAGDPGQCAGLESMDRDTTSGSRRVQALDARMTDPVV